MTVGDRLKAWRTARGLSQAAAAELAGISQNAWWSYEHDRKAPRIDTVLRLCALTAHDRRVRVTPEMFAERAAEHT